MSAETPGGGDEAGRVLLEKFPVDAWLVVVTLEEGEAGELDEVLVPDVVLGQKSEVVVLLAAAFVTSAVVVETPAACDAF